jgi:hypothetical protein
VRLVLALLVVALAGGAVAGLTYRSYAAVHLRKPAVVPLCIRGVRNTLRKPVLTSGTEPRETDTGETVYLTQGEDRAVGCASMIDGKLSRRLAGVFAERDPERRAQGLIQIVRDSAQPDPASDRTFTAFHLLASAAFRALPEELPAVRAASDELDTLFACRFDTRRRCATRPPVPIVVWITGAPAAASLLGLLWIGGSAGIARLRERWRERRAKRSARRQPEASLTGGTRPFTSK